MRENERKIVHFFVIFGLIAFGSVSGQDYLTNYKDEKMPKRRERRKNAYWHILGFKEYINLAEKCRPQFYEKENIFEKYLTYAIIFGITDKWAKAFEGIFVTHPSWDEGKFAKGFTSLNFTNSLNNVLSAMDHAFSNALGSRSSGLGGGFSGGGRGGRGGGSW